MKRIIASIFVLAAAHGASASSSESKSGAKAKARAVKTIPETTANRERHEAADAASGPTLTTTSKQAAKKETWGLGISLDSPSGIVGQAPLLESSIVRGGAGWRSGNARRPFFFVDALYRMPDWIQIGSAHIPVQFGLGVSYQPAHEIWDDSVAVRIPVGLYYKFESSPLELNLTFAPNIYRSRRDAGTSSSHTMLALLYKF